MTPEQELLELGFCTFQNVYSDSEIEQISTLVNSVDQYKLNFRKTNELFAIPQFSFL